MAYSTRLWLMAIVQGSISVASARKRSMLEVEMGGVGAESPF